MLIVFMDPHGSRLRAQGSRLEARGYGLRAGTSPAFPNPQPLNPQPPKGGPLHLAVRTTRGTAPKSAVEMTMVAVLVFGWKLTQGWVRSPASTTTRYGLLGVVDEPERRHGSGVSPRHRSRRSGEPKLNRSSSTTQTRCAGD